MALFDIFKFWQREDEEDVIEQERNQRVSFSAPDNTNGATEVERTDSDTLGSYQVFQQQFYSTGPKVKTTRDLINSYRALADYHEVDNAIQEIVFDAIVYENGVQPVTLELSDTKFSPKIQEMIHSEMTNVLNLYKFNKNGTKLFRKWYTDSRIYFHKILHKDPKKGIQELRVLDPRKMEYVREIEKETREGIDYVTKIKEFFIYDNSVDDPTIGNTPSMSSNAQRKIRIPRNMLVFATSGLVDATGKNVIGYLQRAMRPANQLKMLEDSLVIYRITRAPERRVFYIDVGNMPNKKATQHVNQIMQGLKNRVVYDSTTGKVKNQYNNLAMSEDYWLMRRDGKATTEVDTLPGAQSLGSIEDVNYFNKKLYEALHIPLSRLPNESGGVQFGGGGEISRDEMKFAKYIRTLQVEFKEIFLDPLKTNLVLKGIITEEEWDENENSIFVNFNKDSYFEELQETEVLARRLEAAEAIREYVGRYVSNDYVMKNIFKMSEDDILEQRKLIEKEMDDEVLKDPALELEEEI